MKYIFTSLCLGLALIFTASAQDKYSGGNTTATVHRGTARASTVTAPAATTTHRGVQPTMTQRNISTAPFRHHTYTATPRVNTNATVHSDITANARVRDRSARFSDQTRVRSNVAVNRDRNFRTSGNAAANVGVSRNRNVTVTNNWRSSRFSGQQYAAFRDYHRSWHDRAWWSSHHNRIVFVSGGWWYWDAGYWFPAWGYDSSAYYPYDGPIYGYSDL